MARVIGPLFSQEARGQFGQTVVFNRRLGQNTVRAYVVPANPQTDAQVAVRIILAAAGLITKAIRATDWTYAGQTNTFIQFLRGRTRIGEVWNSAFSREMTGPSNANYNAALAQYTGLDAAVQALWQAAATNANAGLVDYTRAGTTVMAGFQLFLAERTIAADGYGDPFVPAVPVAIVAS